MSSPPHHHGKSPVEHLTGDREAGITDLRLARETMRSTGLIELLRLRRTPRGEAVDAMMDRLSEPVFIRVSSDAAGETHFEEIRLPGETRRSEVSASVAWWSEEVPVRSLVWRRVEKEAPPTVPHPAPRRQLIVPLSGAVEIEVSTGERRTVVPGQILMVDDVTGKGHITRAADDATRVTLVLELADEPVPAT